MATWLYSGASVVGQSHQTTNTPCQDKFQIQTSLNGEWLAVAVCDGAGSAEFAELGATVTSTHFCQELIKLSEELETRVPGEWINDFVIDCVIRVREQLRKVAQSDDIRKYHCTLVAALIGKSGGFSIHIGDGAILGGSFSSSSKAAPVDLNTGYFISKPENGEYANETFFITEGSWVKHLRITPLPASDWLIACTDGGASLVLDNDHDVKPNFVAPFIEAQVNQQFSDRQYVENILNDSKANKLTTDDKTIVLAVRNNQVLLPVNLRFTAQEKTTTPPNTARTTSVDSPINTTKHSPPPATKTTTRVAGDAEKKNYGPAANPQKKLIYVLSGAIVATVALVGGVYLYLKQTATDLPKAPLNTGAPGATDNPTPLKEIAGDEKPSHGNNSEKASDEAAGR